MPRVTTRLAAAEKALDAVIKYTHDLGNNTLKPLPVDGSAPEVWDAIRDWVDIRKREKDST